MQIPTKVTFKDMPVSDAMGAAAMRHCAELEQFHPRMTRCEVTIASPHRHHRKGRLYSVRVDLTVPGSEIVVNREHPINHAHEDPYVALRDAFRAARRRLEDDVRRRRLQVKSHIEPALGRITRIFPDDGYAFIEAADGRQIYMHRNSLIQGEFGRLAIGDHVHYIEETGEQGANATSVRPVHPHKKRGRAGRADSSTICRSRKACGMAGSAAQAWLESCRSSSRMSLESHSSLL